MENRPRKRGRPRGPRFIKYQLTLDEDSGEWGKSQPEGLSALVRRLLKAERSRCIPLPLRDEDRDPKTTATGTALMTQQAANPIGK